MKKYVSSSIADDTLLQGASLYQSRLEIAADAIPHLRNAISVLSESIEDLHDHHYVDELDGSVSQKEDLKAGLYNIQNAKRCIEDALEYLQDWDY